MCHISRHFDREQWGRDGRRSCPSRMFIENLVAQWRNATHYITLSRSAKSVDHLVHRNISWYKRAKQRSVLLRDVNRGGKSSETGKKRQRKEQESGNKKRKGTTGDKSKGNVRRFFAMKVKGSSGPGLKRKAASFDSAATKSLCCWRA